MADAIGKTSHPAKSAVADDADRRSVPRYIVNADTEVEEPLTQAKVSGRTADLGLGGCYVDSLTIFPAGTDVVVRITRAGTTFAAEAKVLYGKPGMGMGMAFAEMEQEKRNLLVRWILELSGSPNPGVNENSAPSVKDQEAIDFAVIGHLITLLMRKGTLSQSEGEHLRRELDRKPRDQ
ncbi:MAG TPA: PilZ domain-containing protein [Candidatus Acidoferrales bacterium]|jgi:hypothetical protein|nr:PilZ domain-containing protein [Candidatus Acidoferrales bacterium]